MHKLNKYRTPRVNIYSMGHAELDINTLNTKHKTRQKNQGKEKPPKGNNPSLIGFAQSPIYLCENSYNILQIPRNSLSYPDFSHAIGINHLKLFPCINFAQ